MNRPGFCMFVNMLCEETDSRVVCPPLCPGPVVKNVVSR
jgi:hypothetical protein